MGLSGSRRTEPSIIDAETMATTAMSSPLTIGLEQIIVSLGLLLVSLFVLSRSGKRPKVMQRLCEVLMFPFRKRRTIRRNTSYDHHQGTSVLRNRFSTFNLMKLRGSNISNDGSTSGMSMAERIRLGTARSLPTTPIRKSRSSPFISIDNTSSSPVSFCTGLLRPHTPTPSQDGEGDESVTPTTETDHERFTRAYNTRLRISDYRRLILPPECQLLDPSKIHKYSDKTSSPEHNLDDSWLAFPYYTLDIVHKIISFDYIGNTLHFNYRIWEACRIRLFKILGRNVVEEEEEEEDADGDEGSVSSNRSLLSRDSVLNQNLNGSGTMTLNGTSQIRSTSPYRTSQSRSTSPLRKSKIEEKTEISGEIKTIQGKDTATGLHLSFSEDGSMQKSQSGNTNGGPGRERFYTGEIFNATSSESKPFEGMPSTVATSMTNLAPKRCVEMIPKGSSKPSTSQSATASTIYDYDFDESLHSLSAVSEDLNTWAGDEKKEKAIEGSTIDGNGMNADANQNEHGPQHMQLDRHHELTGQDSSPARKLPLSNGERHSPFPSTLVERKNNNVATSSTPTTPVRSVMKNNIGAEYQYDHEGYSTPDSQQQSFEGIGAMGQTKRRKSADQLSLPLLSGRSNSVGGKQKDFLEKFRNRGMGSSIVAQAPASQVPSSSGIEPSLPSSQSNVVAPSQELSYFDSATNKDTIERLERAAPLPDREGYILGDQFLEDKSDTPLLVFVNTRSGSQQGPMLKTQLRSLLNPIQVWDLADGGPEKILKSFSVLTRLRLLVCGGDGTVSWVISTLDKMNLDRWPPIAILPLGTGNDLARVHGWGAGYANESLLLILNQVQESYISLLDRWALKIEETKKKGKKRKKKGPVSKPFINYMSIGMDAVSALQVHNLRENSPNMFFSRAVNKVWYALFGAEEAIKASCSKLPQQIILEADGVEVPIPPDSQGLIFLNIDSYLGGVPLWSRGVPIYKTKPKKRRERRYSEGDFSGMIDATFLDRKRAGSYDENESFVDDSSALCDEEYDESLEDKLERIVACNTPSSCQDGRLDVISYRGNFHLGQIRVGLSYAQKLCQCSKVKIKMMNGVAVQLDGEPWKQAKGILTIERQKDPAIMLHKALEEGGGIETEVSNLLEWAEEKKIIHRETHATLMKEFSRRIEKKTRARRNRSQQTVFATMKRRIASANRLPP